MAVPIRATDRRNTQCLSIQMEGRLRQRPDYRPRRLRVAPPYEPSRNALPPDAA